jgi:hypothetical protein
LGGAIRVDEVDPMSLRAAAALGTIIIAVTGIATSPCRAQSPLASSDQHFGAWFQTVGKRDPDGRALYVGDLEGRAHHVLSADAVQGTGPRGGRVLIWLRDGKRSVVELVEARSGARTELLRTERPIAAAAFGLDEDWYYIVENERGSSTRGLFRRRFAGGKAQRVADGWAGSGTSMYPSTDGTTVAIASLDPDSGSSTYRILDLERRRVSVLPGRTYKDVVGMLGDELVVWEDAPMDALKLPLRAIDRDGASRRIADQDGWAAAVYPALDGSARLVYEGIDETGHHTLSVLEPGGSTGRVIYSGGPDSFDPPVQVVWRTQWMGIEVPGYVPVFPNAQVFLGDEYLETYGHLPRTLGPLDGGEPITLAPQPHVTTWGPMAVVHDTTRDGLDAGLGPGTLVIGETCTTLEVEGRPTTLVWRDWQAAWDPEARAIRFEDRSEGELELVSGDRLTLGGYAPWVEGAGGPPAPPWLVPPDPTCPSLLFLVHSVTRE